MMRRVPLALLVAIALAVPASVAAATPELTTTVVAGHEIDVVGSGFPAAADVTLDIQRNGAAAGSQSLRTDASGGFSATIPAGPGRGGRYELVATAGTVRAVASVVAVETAGGAGGTRPSAPATDSTAAGGPASPASLPIPLAGLAALVLVAIGLAILAVDRRGSAARD